MTYRDKPYRRDSFAEGRFDVKSDLFYGEDDKTGRGEWSGWE
jgi:hypothetical protein